MSRRIEHLQRAGGPPRNPGSAVG